MIKFTDATSFYDLTSPDGKTYGVMGTEPDGTFTLLSEFLALNLQAAQDRLTAFRDMYPGSEFHLIIDNEIQFTN